VEMAMVFGGQQYTIRLSHFPLSRRVTIPYRAKLQE